MKTDQPMSAKKQAHSYVDFLPAALMSVHYLVGISCTLLLRQSFGGWVSCLWFTLPYVAITGVFTMSIYLKLVHRRRWSRAALLLGLTLSAGAFAYDCTQGRTQVDGRGIERIYTIWWWRNGPNEQGFIGNV